MEKHARWKKLLFPPLPLLLILCAVSAAGLALVFLRGLSQSPPAWAVYALSFYTLCALCAFCCAVLPGRYRRLRGRVAAHPLGMRCLTDAVFRAHLALYAALCANLLYAGVNILSFFLYRSMWFAVLAFYYVILSVMRFLLLRCLRGNAPGQDRAGELRRARLCSCILLLVNFALAGAVLMMLYQNRGWHSRGVLIYVTAGYTFYLTIHAVTALIRYRKYRSPVMTTAKIISLCTALVSMLSLESAMLSQFGADMAPAHQRLMIALTGAGVSIAVIVLSVGMIVGTAGELKEIRQNGK